MTRALLLLLLSLAACSSARNQPARQSEDTETGSPLSVHPDIDHRIRYVKHSTDRTADGRLVIKLVIASESGKDLVLVARTDWFDAGGDVVERSASRVIVIPSGQTYLYEDTSYSPTAARFGVSVRPATTKRKD